jgi:hypothetical protein
MEMKKGSKARWGLHCGVLACGIGMVLALAPPAQGQTAGTTRANDSQFKISPMNSTSVTNKRNALRSFIWGSPGFPATKMPSSRRTLNTSPVGNIINLQTVQALTISMEAGQSTVAYHFLPVNRFNRLVIVHQGHGCDLDDGQDPGSAGIARTISTLVASGFSVLAMNMPHMRPANPEMGLPGECDGNHPAIFNLATTGGSSPMKFFVEPVVVAINFLASSQSLVRYTDFNMIGLSGGGWTTTLAAAVDPRIKLSFPVAGTVPMYLRVEPYNHDIEQFLPQLYGQRSPFLNGVAGYMDLYALGATGSGRKQHQILNRHDNCCFGEASHIASVLGPFDAAVRSYESRLKTAVSQVGSGAFRLIIDETSFVHQISDNAISNVIIPVLAGSTQLTTTVHPMAGGIFCVDIPDNGRPLQNQDIVQIFQCHGGSNQQFRLFSDGTFRLGSTNFCLDVPNFGRPPQAHDLLQIYQCNGGTNQQFDILGDGSIRSRWGGLCLDIPDNGRPPQNWDRPQLYQCHGGINQKFAVNR